MALSYMSERSNDPVSAREITEYLNCPFHPFSRVLQKLVDQEIIVSKQGIKGGYFLNKNLEELSFYQLMRAVLPQLEIADCISCSCDLLQTCNIKKPIHNLNKRFLDFYKSLNVSEILGKDSYKQAQWKSNLEKKQVSF